MFDDVCCSRFCAFVFGYALFMSLLVSMPFYSVNSTGMDLNMFLSFSKSQYYFLGDFFFFFLFSDFFSLLSLLSMSLSLSLSHFPIGWCHWLFAFYFLFDIISFSLDFIQFYYFIYCCCLLLQDASESFLTENKVKVVFVLDGQKC